MVIGPSDAVLIGAIIGAVVGAVVVILMVMCFIRCLKSKIEEEQRDAPETESGGPFVHPNSFEGQGASYIYTYIYIYMNM
jgi:hypothetical protein